MPDVALSSRCSCLTPDGRKCLLTYQPCAFPVEGAGACAQSGFMATISAPPDEFYVLLNSAGRPRRGLLVLQRCGATETWPDVAGVHVEAIPDCCCGISAPLEATWRDDGSVEYLAQPSGARLIWRNGQFTLG